VSGLHWDDEKGMKIETSHEKVVWEALVAVSISVYFVDDN
jgi:hypothetical protein